MEPLSTPTRRRLPWASYVLALAVVAGSTAADWLLFARLDLANLVMIYLAGVLVVAYRSGTGPSVAASVASVLAFDFFFVPPRFTFAVANAQHLITFGVMLAVALSISHLTVRVKREAELARAREHRTATLYSLGRSLATGRGTDELLEIAVRHVADEFACSAAALLPDRDGKLAVRRGAIAEFGTVPKEVAVAQWAFDSGEMAGWGTETVATAGALFVPLRATGTPVGALGVRPASPERALGPEQVRLLEAIADQTALAVANDLSAEEHRRIEIQMEGERQRSALLGSVSHDLRTPLAAITGSASTLLREGAAPDAASRRDLLENIRDEADRLNRIVGNLLEMTRLDSGPVELHKEPHHIEEVIGSAIAQCEDRVAGRPLVTTITPDCPLVPMDALLIEQVLVNLLDNACKYAPVATPVEIAARVRDGRLEVSVADRGPGLPMEDLDRLFDKFYRGRTRGSQAGAGLGLAICRAAVEAHGGEIFAGNREGGGARFEFTLPLGEPRT